ncbi:unnamed protein product [Rhodiola kirilowii]
MNDGDMSMSEIKCELAEKLVEVRDKIQLLGNLEISVDSALLYLDLQSNAQSLANSIQPLAEAAKQFLRSQYNDVNKCSKEILGLPIAGFEAVLANDGLRAWTENDVLNLVLKYIHTHYPSIEERQNVLMTRLCPLIQFKNLSRRKLRRVLNSPDFSSEPIYKAVLDSYLMSDMTPPRMYTQFPVEVRSFELSQPRCDVYLKLKRDECANLFPDGRVHSKTFHLDGHTFCLRAACEQNGPKCFGLGLSMIGMESEICHVQYKFSVIAKPSEYFEDKFQGTYTLTGKKGVCVLNLMKLAWEDFIAVDSKYFVADILYLKVELIVKNDPQQH